MKKFEKPEIEVVELESQDVMTTSREELEEEENGGGWAT